MTANLQNSPVMTANIRNSPVTAANVRNLPAMTANMRNLPVMTANMRNSPVAATNMRNLLVMTADMPTLPVMTANKRNLPVIKDDRYMSHTGHRKEDNPSEKNIIVEEELDGIDRDDIGNLENLLGLVLTNEECWNPKVVVDGGGLARNINQKKKPDVFQACRYPLCDKCYRQEYFFNKHLEYCQLGKYDISCGLVVNNLKQKQLFSDQMNRNHFDLILARRYWICSTKENLRCLNSAVYEII